MAEIKGFDVVLDSVWLRVVEARHGIHLVLFWIRGNNWDWL